MIPAYHTMNTITAAIISSNVHSTFLDSTLICILGRTKRITLFFSFLIVLQSYPPAQHGPLPPSQFGPSKPAYPAQHLSTFSHSSHPNRLLHLAANFSEAFSFFSLLQFVCLSFSFVVCLGSSLSRTLSISILQTSH